MALMLLDWDINPREKEIVANSAHLSILVMTEDKFKNKCFISVAVDGWEPESKPRNS